MATTSTTTFPISFPRRLSRWSCGLATLLALGGSALGPEEARAEQFLSLYHRPGLEWYTIETEHFMVHYPVSRKEKGKTKHYVNGEWAARKVAKVSEDYWEPMCKEFGYYLQEKVHIVVLEQYDELQGFTIPARNWVEISGNPGSTFARLRGRSEWFSNVLVHEFAHVVSLKRNAAIAENVPALVMTTIYQNNALGGRNGQDVDSENGAQIIVSDRTEPWWWTEGGAEYWSSRSGYNWWSTARDRHIRNTILEDRALTYDQWKSTQGVLDWGDGERGYQQGHSIALYFRMRFGEDFFASLANEHDKAWRAHWETMIEEKTGVTGRELYADWKAWVEEYYQREYAEVLEAGEAKGRELDVRPTTSHFTTPGERDKFFTKEKKVWGEKVKVARPRNEWEREKDSTGRSETSPRYSDDGRWLGQSSAGINISRTDESLLPARSADRFSRPENSEASRQRGLLSATYPAGFAVTFDFVPGKDQIVTVLTEDQIQRSKMPYYGLRVETDGFDWNQLVIFDLETRSDVERHGESKDAPVETLRPKRSQGSWFSATYRQFPKLSMTVIPNTQRGTDPAVSPDGKRVAYLEYEDGTQNLVVIDLDGSNKVYLTNFESGELFQSVDWSPDGKQVVFALFKNYQSDLWIMDVESKAVRALNHDRSEELDVHWSAHDGNIYFSSDVTGIYNNFRYDVTSKRIHQLTNVITTAYAPHLTPRGDLLYMNVTAFGEKNYILAREEFLERDRTALFGLTFDEAKVASSWAHVEDLSRFEANTRSYNPLARFHPPAVIPILQLSNPALPTFALQTGVQVSSFDYGEKHEVLALGLAGTNMIIGGGYTFRGWHPEIGVFVQHAQTKSDFGFLLDNDNNKETAEDQEIWEFRQNNYQNAVFLNANYPLNQQVRLNGSAGFFEFGFRSVADLKFAPFTRSLQGRLGFEFSNLDFGLNIGQLAFSARGINPTGRYVTIDYTHGFTDNLQTSQNGVATDDGERLDKYNYNGVQLRWTEHMRFPFSSKAAGKGHKLQLDVQAAAIDRNVQLFDEYRGGFGHPLSPGVGPGSVQPNMPFSGYPQALLGETMFVASAYWRAPIKAKINEKWGPLYMRDIYFQGGGSAGNFWSYRPPDEEDFGTYYYDNQGNRIAYDPKDVRREIPFVDKAYKNGNYLLTDISAEIRVSSLLMNNTFNSFLRVSYGLQEVTGIFDVTGDDINDQTNSGFGNAISVESEKPGPRIFLGIGSGW